MTEPNAGHIYVLKRYALGRQPGVSITREEYESIVESKRRVLERLAVEELLDLGFTAQLASVSSAIAQLVEEDPRMCLHNIVAQLYDIPYFEAKAVLGDPKLPDSNPNRGAVTGLFFEQLVASVVVPYLRKHVPNVVVSRNRCEDPVVRKNARDPDLVFTVASRTAVFEAKVSPKKGDLEYIRQMRERYVEREILYFLVGGYVTAASETLRSLGAGRWACFMNASARNQLLLDSCAKLDVVLATARKHLVPD